MLVGGATESIFPEVEALLLSGSTDYQEALEYVAARKKMDRYRSMVDFLFCEIHPQWRMACNRYYAGNGPKLMEQVTSEQVEGYNHRLLVALDIARKIFAEKRRDSWEKYREEVLKEAA